jgi:hypothetical protein
MTPRSAAAVAVQCPIAVRDAKLDGSVTVEMFELCTVCGARFGIGYPKGAENERRLFVEPEELPKKLTDILFKDHRQMREHSEFIDLDL